MKYSSGEVVARADSGDARVPYLPRDDAAGRYQCNIRLPMNTVNDVRKRLMMTSAIPLSENMPQLVRAGGKRECAPSHKGKGRRNA
jgi:hypothetical protein